MRETHSFSPSIRDVARVHVAPSRVVYTAAAYEAPVEPVELLRPCRLWIQPELIYERRADLACTEVVCKPEVVVEDVPLPLLAQSDPEPRVVRLLLERDCLVMR